ncbi:DUF5333 family protein [Meridianimarinicoccus sp. RP-17]
MKWPKRVALVGTIAVTVAACAPRMAPPPAFADYAANVQVARLLAGACPSVALDQSAMGAGARDLGVALRDQGFTPDDIAAFPNTLDTGAIEARTRAYLAANAVDLDAPATACTAARAEMDRGSAIGAFLTAG